MTQRQNAFSCVFAAFSPIGAVLLAAASASSAMLTTRVKCHRVVAAHARTIVGLHHLQCPQQLAAWCHWLHVQMS